MTSPVPFAAFPVGLPTLTGVCGAGSLPPGRGWPMFHDDWDLWFVERGQVTWELKDGRRLRAGKNQFLLLPPFIFVQCRTTLRPAVSNWFCHFGFRPIPVRMTGSEFRQDCGEGRPPVVVPLMFSRRAAPSVWRALRELVRGQRAQRGDSLPWRMEYAAIALVSALAGFARRRAEAAGAPDMLIAAGTPDARVAEVCRRIHQNPAFPWKIAAEARSLGLSAGHLNELCHATLGKSLKSHLGEVRMQLALQLLRSSGAAEPPSLKEICAACGFSSPQFFNRQFKTFYGIPPALARKQAHLI